MLVKHELGFISTVNVCVENTEFSAQHLTSKTEYEHTATDHLEAFLRRHLKKLILNEIAKTLFGPEIEHTENHL